MIHGDIKAANVLISRHVRALLCDFGLSKRHNAATSVGAKAQGSQAWMSPEALRGDRRTYASDMWSFGMLVYEVSRYSVADYAVADLWVADLERKAPLP